MVYTHTHTHTQCVYMCVIVYSSFIIKYNCLYDNKKNSPIYLKHNKSEIKLMSVLRYGSGSLDKYKCKPEFLVDFRIRAL